MLKAARQRAREKEDLAQNLTYAALCIDARIKDITTNLNDLRQTSEQLLRMAQELRSDGSNV